MLQTRMRHDNVCGRAHQYYNDVHFSIITTCISRYQWALRQRKCRPKLLPWDFGVRAKMGAHGLEHALVVRIHAEALGQNTREHTGGQYRLS